MLSQQDQLDHAATYIKHLRERIEKLKGRKEQAIRPNRGISGNYGMMDEMFNITSILPVLELKDLGSGIEVMLISGLNKNFMFYEVIGVLEEEGAEVVSASFSTVGDKIFHTVHAQVIKLNYLIVVHPINVSFAFCYSFYFLVHVLLSAEEMQCKY